MIKIETRRGVIHFPHEAAEVEHWTTDRLRSECLMNDPNGEWGDDSEEGPTREDMIEQLVVWGREYLEENL